MNEPLDGHTEARRKSPAYAIAATVLLGPLGLFYASEKEGAVLTLLTIAAALAMPERMTIIGALAWVLAIGIAPFAVSNANQGTMSSQVPPDECVDLPTRIPVPAPTLR